MAPSADLEQRLKTALDESRLLILGAQVLFGFQFEGAFQEQFNQLPRISQYVQCGGLIAMLLSICLLIAPSLLHQIAFAGETRVGVISAATTLAGAGLFPLSLALGAAAFVVFDHLFGRPAGVMCGTAMTAIALSLFYALGFVLRRNGRNKAMPQEPRATPLKTKIEQMLTEARVIIPGGQALLGFQFIAVLTKPFQELPAAVKELHAAGLCAVALAVMLLMTPAAVHRIAFHGEDNEAFFRIGSRLIIFGSLALALGIAANVAIVFYRVTERADIGSLTGALALVVLSGVWFAYPLWRRWRRSP